MSIVQQGQDGIVSVTLPANATAAQSDLATQFAPLLSELNGKASDARFRPLLGRLKTAADLGFDGIGGAPANPTLALVQLGEVKSELTRLNARPGCFVVQLPLPTDVERGREIVFQRLSAPVEVPPDQMEVKGEIEETLMILQLIFPAEPKQSWLQSLLGVPPRKSRFESYRGKLYSLARVGLEGDADPKTAKQALVNLRAEVLAQEGPVVKNSYMKRLGVWAAAWAVAAAILYLIIRANPNFSVLASAYRNLLPLWVGTMIGTWLSFGIRRNVLTLRDLSNLEADMVEPAIRLIFTGLIAVTIAFVFMLGMVNVVVGQLNSSQLYDHGSTAFLIGALLGISEQALPGTLTRRASQFVTEIGGKT